MGMSGHQEFWKWHAGFRAGLRGDAEAPTVAAGEQGRALVQGPRGVTGAEVQAWAEDRLPLLHPLAGLGELTAISRLVSEGPGPVTAMFAPFCWKGRWPVHCMCLRTGKPSH